MIAEGPQDTVSFIGDTVMLRCRSSESQTLMKWGRGSSVTQTIASLSRGVYEGYQKLSLNTSTEGQFDLIINSTQPYDANTYSCIVDFEHAPAAELVLLGKFH